MITSEIYPLDGETKKQLESMMVAQLTQYDSSILPSESLLGQGIFFPTASQEEIAQIESGIFYQTNLYAGVKAYPLFSVPITASDGRIGQLLVVRARFSEFFEDARSCSYYELPSLRNL